MVPGSGKTNETTCSGVCVCVRVCVYPYVCMVGVYVCVCVRMHVCVCVCNWHPKVLRNGLQLQ